MPTLDELNKILSDCCEQLVDCSGMIKEIPLEPAKQNIYKIGKALAEISELRSVIYRIRPDLKPEKWDEPPSDEDFKEMFEEAKRQAEEHCNSGNPEKAVETYESYIFIGPTEKYENLAKDEIEKLQSQYSV